MNYPQSAYLHIPFCFRRCFYCDFPVVPLGDSARGEHGPGSNSIKSYLDLLYRDISLSPKGIPLATIYIGGGTPSLLIASQVANLLDHLRSHFGFQYGAEITLEIDPASFDKLSLEGFLDAPHALDPRLQKDLTFPYWGQWNRFCALYQAYL